MDRASRLLCFSVTDASLQHPLQGTVFFDKVVEQGHGDVTHDHNQQQPRDGGMQAAQSDHPGCFDATGRQQLDAERFYGVTQAFDI